MYVEKFAILWKGSNLKFSSFLIILCIILCTARKGFILLALFGGREGGGGGGKMNASKIVAHLWVVSIQFLLIF